jgi:hypothetical protein
MGKQLKEKEKNLAKEFEKLGKKIISQAKKQGLIAINNRSKLFIHGRPNRRWWFADKKNGLLISVEYGLCDDEALAMLQRNEKK